jgi:uroporphyrinogen decarboxylase
MTSRERVAKLLKRELPDRIGLYDHYWPETLNEFWPEQGFPKDTSPDSYFGYDLKSACGWIDKNSIKGFSEVVEESDEWKLIKQGNGATMRYWKNKSGTPEHVDFDCCTPAKWESVYKPPLMQLDPTRVDVESTRNGLAAAKAEGKFSFFGDLNVFELMRSTLGDVVMLESLALEPEWIEDFCRTYTDFQIKHLDYLFQEAGQPDGAFIYEDLGYNKGLFCSPGMYRELIMPHHKRLFGFFHDRGMPVILHSCGNVTEAVPMVIEAGIDCLQPMEVKAGVDVISLAKQFGDKIAFMGNIDVRVLERGNKEEIEQEVGGKMDAMKSLGAAYFLHSDHSISPKVTLEAYRFAMDVFRAHASY